MRYFPDWEVQAGFTLTGFDVTVDKTEPDSYGVTAKSTSISIDASGVKLSAQNPTFVIAEFGFLLYIL